MRNADIDLVNDAVNRLGYKSDMELYGRADFWTSIADSGEGDCEDSAITKLRRLVALGWPIASLKLACCFIETGEYHAVLIVSTSDGDVMLDNRQPRPVPLGDLKVLGYRPDRIQGEGHTWVRWLK